MAGKDFDDDRNTVKLEAELSALSTVAGVIHENIEIHVNRY